MIRDFLVALAGIASWEFLRILGKIIRIARTRHADRMIAKAMREGLEITAYPADAKWRESDVFTAEWYERHPEERGDRNQCR